MHNVTNVEKHFQVLHFIFINDVAKNDNFLKSLCV